MAEFLEERMPIDVRMGATYADEYNVVITETASWNEDRQLVHEYPRRIFNVSYMKLTTDLWDGLLSLYHRCYGKYAGFRVKCLDDYTTNAQTTAPTAVDQELEVLTAGSSYRLQIQYGSGDTPISIGLPVRTIFKPVSGTVKVAIGSLEQAITTMWTVATTTGVVTFNANKTATITGISQAAQAVVTFASHPFVDGESVYFSGITVGMTQINALRGTIVSHDATHITVNINSTAFTAWSAGGVCNTRPQTGETVYGGCEFDIPCRFNSRIDQIARTAQLFETGEIEVIELLNP
jgi:uncharacterized protein (TIGR02217 family)